MNKEKLYRWLVIIMVSIAGIYIIINLLTSLSKPKPVETVDPILQKKQEYNKIVEELTKDQEEVKQLQQNFNQIKNRAYELSGSISEKIKKADCLKKQVQYLMDNKNFDCNDFENKTSFNTGVDESSTLVTKLTGFDYKLIKKVCLKGKIEYENETVISPLCNDDLYLEVKQIVKDSLGDLYTDRVFAMMIGITMAESHIGINYNNGMCATYNNRSGMKGTKTNEGKLLRHVSLGKGEPDENGCRIYKFSSIQSFWKGFSYTLRDTYLKNCNNPECIVNWRVGRYSQRRVDTVNYFIS